MQRHQVRTSNSEDSPIARMALVAKDAVDIDIDTLSEFVDTVILEPLGGSGIAEGDFAGRRQTGDSYRA